MGCEQYLDPFGSLGPISLMKTLTNSRGATRLLDLRRSPSMVRKLLGHPWRNLQLLARAGRGHA